MAAFETSPCWLGPSLLCRNITFWGQEFKPHLHRVNRRLCSRGFISFFLANAILQPTLMMLFYRTQRFTVGLKGFISGLV